MAADNWFNLDLYNQELQRRLQGVNANGRVFKSWDMFSDGIGNTANDFIKARPDIFGYDAALGSRQTGYNDNGENPTPSNYWDFGAANDILKNYETRRLGQKGVKDGRRDVIVDKRTGEVVYAGMNPYSYDPAKTNLKDAVTFIGGALGGYMGVNALAGLGGSGASGGGLLGGPGASGVGLDAAGNLAGSSLMDGAVSQAMTAAGSLAPEGVAALIPTGAQLGAVGGGSLLAGGLLGGGMGSAPAAGAVAANVAGNASSGSTLDGLKKAGGKVADWAISNPKGAGALLGGLLGGAGGAGGGSGSAGGGYTGPMPTITRGDWNANPQAQMMQVPQFGVQMPTKGQKSSGLLRFGG